MALSREQILDDMTREMYQVRAGAKTEMSDDRWSRVKERYPQSVESCRKAVLREHGHQLPEK